MTADLLVNLKSCVKMYSISKNRVIKNKNKSFVIQRGQEIWLWDSEAYFMAFLYKTV